MTSLQGVTAWTGYDLRGGASPELATEAFARAPMPPTFDAAERFELLAVAARGFRPPRFLSIAESSDDRDFGPGIELGESHEGLRETWSLLYRHVAETGPRRAAPYGLYLLGVNPPAEVTDSELEAFNDFYTHVHLPEVAERRHALRAARYELLREVRRPYNGAPRYLAVYEVDEEGASNRRHTGPAYSAGPDVWRRHTTPWRLWYRQLAALDRTTTPSATDHGERLRSPDPVRQGLVASAAAPLRRIQSRTWPAVPC